MNKIKLYSRLVVVVLAATNGVAVNAESYVIQPGDALSRIAEKKSVQSGFLLSTEQIMLTLYKLNKDAFVNGNIDQLVIASKLEIPDNSADYIQISKIEAAQRLRDKSYLRSLVSSASALGSGKVQELAPASQANSQGYSQVLQTLDSHQQTIDGLKVENVRLTKKFDLLERALGRVVLIQGLLTNDMVQVRTKLMGASAGITKPETIEKSGVNNDTKVAQENKQLLEAQKKLEIEAEQAAKLKELKPAVAPVIPSVESKATFEVEKSNEPVAKPSSSMEGGKVSPVETKAVSGASDDNWMENALIISGILLGVLASWWFVNFYKVRAKKSLMAVDADIETPAMDSNAPAFDLSQLNVETPALQDETIAPVKTIIEKSQKAVKESGRENELGSVLELLDMCLLCGDYEQAHAVTLKALSEHNNSDVLAKKLTFIERKMAKL
ncbi:MAG: hypothetical protein ABL903_13935 [Methylococcales bacterium]